MPEQQPPSPSENGTLRLSVPDTLGPPSTASHVTTGSTIELPLRSGARYTFHGEIGRGGMAQVLRGRDGLLHRELAIKVLHDELRDHPEVIQRFLDEAKIGGQLQHPGIVPVHDLGVMSDGRPFIAMKLVKGQTLADVLRERSDPAHDLPRLLKIFEQVCQTVAYAHSRRVIHRDLKPSNVMVGAFGEVLVMDWGVAKVMGREPEPAPLAAADTAARTEIRTARSDSDHDRTAAGSVLGTYAYMAPEQARGQTDLLDERCDVFGLGAILCEILTGKPPYCDSVADQVRVMALVGDLAAARTRIEQCGADADLKNLTLHCLAPNPKDRLPDAAAVAALVAAHQDSVQQRLQQAEVERAAAQVKAAEERKRRRVTIALAAAVLVAVVTGGGAFTVVQAQRRQARLEQTAMLVTQALEEASARQEQARALAEHPFQAEPLWREALSAAERAEKALAEGDVDQDARARFAAKLTELRSEAAEASRDRTMLERLARARDLSAELQDSDYVRQRRVQDFVFGLAAAPAYAAAFREYGIDVERVSPAEAAQRIRQSPIRLALAAAVDGWYFLDSTAAGGKLLEISQAADPDPLRNRIRAAIASQDVPQLQQIGAEKTTELPAEMLILIADVLHQHEMRAEALDLMERTRQRYPDDFWVNDVLGLHYVAADPPNLEEAARCFAAALAIRPESPLGWCNLGSVLFQQGHLEEAIRVLEQTVRRGPDFTTGYERLVYALLMNGRSEEALAVVQQGLARHPESPMLKCAMAQVLQLQGQRDASEALLREVIAQWPEWFLARVNLMYVLVIKGSTEEASQQMDQAEKSHPDHFQVHSARGALAMFLGDHEGAVAAHRKAVELGPGYPDAWSGLAYALAARGDHAAALAAHRKAVEIAPGNALLRVGLGDVLRTQGKLTEAVAEYQYAIRRNPSLHNAHAGLGLAFQALGQYSDAAAAFREAIRLQPTDGWAYANLGIALQASSDYEAAETALREAIRLRPAEGSFHNLLGNLFFAQDQYAPAAIHYREACARAPENAVFQANLGNTLRLDGKAKDAVPVLREAVRLDPHLAVAWQTLSLVLWQTEAYEEGAAAARKAIERDPNLALAHNALGLNLEPLGRLEEAEAAYRQAIRLAPETWVIHFNLAGALRRQRHYVEAIAPLQEAVRLQPASGEYHSALGENFFALNRFEEAAEAFAKAIECEPNNALYRAYRAYVAFRQNDFARAEEDGRKALELDSGQPVAVMVLGLMRAGQGQPDDAVREYEQALAQNPDAAPLHLGLAHTLRMQHKLPEAEAAYRKALDAYLKAWESNPQSISTINKVDILLGLAFTLLERGVAPEADVQEALELDSSHATGHALLSAVLLRQGKPEEALAAARKGVELDPSNAVAQFYLGEVLYARGEFVEALAAFEMAKQHQSPQANPFSPVLPCDERIAACSRGLQFDADLARLRKGTLRLTDAAEQAALAQFCLERKRDPAMAAELYTAAFAADPALASDLAAGHRFAAARAAVLAAQDAATPEEAEQARWRRQALDWLRADLEAWKARAADADLRDAARKALGGWRQEADLAGVAESEQLDRLLESERTAWSQFWKDWAEFVLPEEKPLPAAPSPGARS